MPRLQLRALGRVQRVQWHQMCQPAVRERSAAPGRLALGMFVHCAWGGGVDIQPRAVPPAAGERVPCVWS